MVQELMIRLVSVAVPAQCSELRIRHCCSCGVGSSPGLESIPAQNHSSQHMSVQAETHLKGADVWFWFLPQHYVILPPDQALLLHSAMLTVQQEHALGPLVASFTMTSFLCSFPQKDVN